MKRYLSIVFLILVFTLTGCGAAEKTATPNKADEIKDKPRIITEQLETESLKQNMLNESVKQSITVYLPPSYFESDKRYPVVYFLHGYDENMDLISFSHNFFDKQMKNTGMQEFIVVEINGRNSLKGSFYVNSLVTGNWEDFVVRDVTSFIDGKYRTIAKRDARGMSGFSMGGFGAYNLAFKHPDVYSVLYSLSPGAFDANGLKNAMGTWDIGFLNAYGAAFSPDVKGTVPYAKIPRFDGSDSDKKIVDDWEKGFGDLKGKIEKYKALNMPLTAIRLAVGNSDNYPWIMDGTKYLSKLLKDEGIDNQLDSFSGGHFIDPAFYDKNFVEFFSKNLKNN